MILENNSGFSDNRTFILLYTYQQSNLLLLDEPANHFDLKCTRLSCALQNFRGAMVIVSHDHHLQRVTCDRLMLVHDARVNDFPLSLDEYLKWLSEQGRQSAVDSTVADRVGDENTKPVAKKDRRRTEAV